MSAIPYENKEEGWDDVAEDEDTVTLPRRPRRQFFTRGSMALLAVLLCAAGFYAGVRVEKAQLAGASSTSSLVSAASRAASAFASRLGTAGGARGSSSSGGFAGAGGNGSFGTVSSVSGNAIYVTETATGNVIKVTLNGATKVTKNIGVAKSALRPGDTVVIQGLKGSNGTITATSVSDSGARSGGAGAGSGGGALSQLFSGSGSGGSSGSAGGAGGTGSGSGSAGSGAVNQLFGSGGKG